MTDNPEQTVVKPPPGPVDLVATADGTTDVTGRVSPSIYGVEIDPREVNHCRSCNALIWWRINPTGARQPFDYDAVNRRGTEMPHHATCPQGREWQRGRR